MWFTPIEDRSRNTGWRLSLLIARFLLLAGLGLLFTSSGRSAAPRLELFPKYFRLHPGERIHYNVCPSEEVARYLKGTLSRSEFHCPDAKFSTEDTTVLRLIPERIIKNGEETAVDGVLEAVRSGRTNLVVRTPNSQQRFTITVTGAAQSSFKTVPFTAVKEIKAKEFVFVGHANRDGYDYTAVAKPGIDRVVAEARKHHVPVVFWVSNEYPNWYTSDRRPDYAFVSEGQEHEIHVESERVTFTGGSFMMCVLRNAQMTLHGMLKHDAQRVNFSFTTDAIWVEDMDRGDKRWYPTPTVVLATLLARRPNDTRKYEEIVVPFLDHMINEFPAVGYPRNPPTPPLAELLKDWNIVARFGDGFERFYRRADSNKTLLIEFPGAAAMTFQQDPPQAQKPKPIFDGTGLSLGTLVDQFKNEKVFWIQLEIAKEIVKRHDPSVLSILVDWLNHEDRHIRGNVAFIFGRLGDPRGLRVITEILTDRSERPEGQGGRTCCNNPSYSVALQIAQDRYYAAHLLAELGDPKAVPVLVRFLKDPELNYKIPWVLGQIDGRGAVGILLEALDDDSPRLRVTAIEELEALHAREALPRLRLLLNDDRKVEGSRTTVADAARAAIANLQ